MSEPEPSDRLATLQLKRFDKGALKVPVLDAVERRAGLSAEAFLARFYVANRPAILTGELDAWPALSRWTEDYLMAEIGGRVLDDLAELREDVGFLDRFLDPDAQETMWLGSPGAATPLASADADQFLVQAVGRQWVSLAPPAGKRALEVELAAGEVLFIPFGWRRQLSAPEFAAAIVYEGFRWRTGAAS